MSNWDKTEQKDWSLRFFFKGLKSLWELLGDEKKNFIYVVVWLVFISVLSLSFPYFLKLIFDEIPNVLAEARITSYLIGLVVTMFSVKVFTLILHHFIKEIRFLKSLIKLENFWPVMAQEKLLALSLGYHEKENTGKKIAKINKGCEKMVDIIANVFGAFLPQLLFFSINTFIVLLIDWRLGLIFFLPFIPAAIINLKCYYRFVPDWEKWEAKKEASTGLFCQSLINIQTVQNFVQEKKEKSNLFFIRKQMETLDVDINVQLQKYLFAISLILNTAFVSAILVGIYFVFKGQSTVGTVVYLIVTGNVTIQSLWGLISVYIRVMRNLVAVVRMKELIDEKVDIKNSPNALIPQSFCGNFKFKNVDFIYPRKGRPVLENFNLKIKPNQMVALVGRSGEGKTTVVRLICRMYDITRGSILLDGQDIRNLDLFWYRRLFAIVQQDVDIFDTSLLDNVTYSYPDASSEQVQEALKAAHLKIIFENKDRFPNGIQTQLGERGVRLSGGERQRVGIARAYLALLSGAKVLILDEATSSLDSEAERAIQWMINKLRKEMSVSIIAIAHRLSTIQKADVIYVIDSGVIVERGNHYRLMVKKGLYYKWVKLQKLNSKV